MAKQGNFDYYYQKIPAPIRNKYLIATAIFVLWMLFFDRYSFSAQVKLQTTLESIESQLQYHKEQKQATRRQNQLIHTNYKSLEHFARSQYFMKRSDEEVFPIVDPKNQLIDTWKED